MNEGTSIVKTSCIAVVPLSPLERNSLEKLQ